MIGLSAHDIYVQLHSGAGVGSIYDAQAASANVRDSQIDRANRISQLAAKIADGWQGQAGEAAYGSAQPLAKQAIISSSRLDTAQNLLERNAESFERARHEVKPVPPTPPESNLLNDMLPWETDLDEQIKQYQADANHNIRVFDSYDMASLYNETNMPLDYGTVGDMVGETTVISGTTQGNGEETGTAGNRTAESQRNTPEQPTRNEPAQPPRNRPEVPVVRPGDALHPPGGPGDPALPPGRRPGEPGHPGGRPPILQPPQGTDPAAWTPPRHGGGQLPPGQHGGGTGGGGTGGGHGFTAVYGGFAGGASGSAGDFGVRGPGGSGLKSGGIGAGNSGPGGLGAGGAGTGGAGGPGGANAAGPRGAAGAPGMAGTGAGRSEGADDYEHETAEYLLNPDPDETFGDDRATAPPVIGE